MSILHQWAIKHGVSAAALQDLQRQLGTLVPELPPPPEVAGKSEAFAQSRVRLMASAAGVRLTRNNVGALKDETGRVVRYGLFNESKQVNELVKSSDLIGWRTVHITPPMVGTNIAQFFARECKEPAWQYTGTERETAQLAFIHMLLAAGGDAAFSTGASL